MKKYYHQFADKATMDSAIAGNAGSYETGTLAVDIATGKVYVSFGGAFVLIGGQ